MRPILPVAMSLIILSAAEASAGVIVTSNSTDLETKQTRPTTIYADADKLKVVNENSTIIYRGDLKKLWIINTGRKSYMEMTPETMQQMAGELAGVNTRLEAAQAQLQAKLATMPPEQRAQMEAMLAGRGGSGSAVGLPGGRAPAGARASQVTYAKAGPNKTIAKMRCNGYRKTINGSQNEDVCITPISTAGLTAADFKVLDSFSSFAEPIVGAPQANRNDFMDWNAMNRAIGFQGFPLDTIHYEDGKATRQDTVQKIERLNISAGTFELPAGLTQQGIPTRPPR